jgi:hypothetical protein
MDARIAALQTSVDRLTTLMGQAGSVADLLSAEQELTSRQADLDSLRAQRTALTGQVAMSTLTVSIGERAAEPKLAPGGFTGGLQRGWHGLLNFINALVAGAGVLLPWLIPLAVVAGAVWFLVRHARRRLARRRAADRGPGGTPGSGMSDAGAPGAASAPPAPPMTPSPARAPGPGPKGSPRMAP